MKNYAIFLENIHDFQNLDVENILDFDILLSMLKFINILKKITFHIL